MRREGAMRLSITIDKDLVEWLDQYAWGTHQTKSAVIEELVKALYHEMTDEDWDLFNEVLRDVGKNETV